MEQVDRQGRMREMADRFNHRFNRDDGWIVANSLTDGLRVLRDFFFLRVHIEVEQKFGMDSMLSPLSAVKSESRAKAEIEVYQVAESAAEVVERKYLPNPDDWYVKWLAECFLESPSNAEGVQQRLAHYASRSPDDRRRAFARVLERTFPEAQHAPLVVYRLLPLGTTIVTAVAFGDHQRASADRKRQAAILPNIMDCQSCHGAVLENGEKCSSCGNPLWKYDWLIAD